MLLLGLSWVSHRFGGGKQQSNLKTTTTPAFGTYPKELMSFTERYNKDVHYNFTDSTKKKNHEKVQMFNKIKLVE